MKFLVPLALLAAGGVSAQDKDCAADYIVTQCLSTETLKAQACNAADWDCLCAAYEAIATCYNNCPNDPRAFSARGQVTNYCANASVFGSKAKAAATTAATASATGSLPSGTVVAQTTDSGSGSGSGSDTSAATDTTASPTASGAASNAGTSSSAKPSTSNAADALSGSTGGMVVAVAGVVAALL